MRWVTSAVLSVFAVANAYAESPKIPEWREVAPDNLVLIDVPTGRVVVELAPELAPRHAERFRALIRAKFYDGQSFYRVIDGFVAQGGRGEGEEVKKPEWPALAAEFDVPAQVTEPFVPLGPDLFAPEVGHWRGFPIGRDAKEKRAWLLHCPGTLAFARDNDPNTADTEFYFPIGHAPRRLDRSLTAFGRVLEGMMHLQKLKRGDPDVEGGVISKANQPDPILRIQLASELPEAERPKYQVQSVPSPAFDEFIKKKRTPAPEFYKRVWPNLDICAFQVPVRKAP